MPRKTVSDVQAELDDANDYISELEDKLNNLAGIVTGEDDTDEQDDDGTGDDYQD
jgi:hypothetical protein